nr:BACON domain-containing carbohydrate-binding protein [uncultured Porphyromonas sp.]
MRRNIKYLLGCLALLLALPACKTQNEIEEPSLDLSVQTLTFAKEGAEQTVTVTTNKENWSAFSTNEAWLSVEQAGNTLKVKATRNENGQLRKASVVVNAGGLQKRVAVTQSSADVIFETETPSISLSEQGEARTIKFDSNSGTAPKVELATTVDWLTISDVTARSFKLTAKPSTEQYERKAKVLLTFGTTTKEIEVRQLGTVQYVLPILKYPAGIGEVMSEEARRGHALIQLPDGLFNSTSYRVATRSKTMTYIQYEFSSKDARGFTSATTTCSDSTLIKDNAHFDAFLKDNGFNEPEYSKDRRSIVYKSSKIPLQIKVLIKEAGTTITTTYDPRQDKECKTFSTLPLQEQIKLLGNRDLKIMGKKRDEVRKIEEGWGGTREDKLTYKYYDRFKVKNPFETESFHGYFYVQEDKKKGITPDDEYYDVTMGVQSIFYNTELGFWMDLAGDFHLSKEVREFLEKNGFKYFGVLSNGGTAFFNKEKKLAYVLSVPKTKYEGRYILEIQALYSNVEGKNNFSVQTLNDYKSYLRAMQAHQAELAKIEAALAKVPLR